MDFGLEENENGKGFGSLGFCVWASGFDLVEELRCVWDLAWGLEEGLMCR